MLSTYQALARLALDEFGTQGLNIVTRATFVGGTPASPNKLRLILTDESFLDVWLSADGDYAYGKVKGPFAHSPRRAASCSRSDACTSRVMG